MNSPNSPAAPGADASLDLELAALERKFATLASHVRALRAANAELARELAAANTRSHQQSEKLVEARRRLDQLLARLPPRSTGNPHDRARGPKAVAADKTVTLDVALLGREYKVACKESERAELVEAVALLDRRMRDIRDTGKITGVERVAVMAALNLAHELMRAKAGGGHPRAASTRRPPVAENAPVAHSPIDADAARRRIGNMHSAIDALMAEQEKLF